MSPVTFNLDNLTDPANPAPLFCQCPGELTPQAALVFMNERGEVTADYRGEVGHSITMYEFHGRLLSWRVSPYAKGEPLATLLQGAARPLLEAIHEGHAIYWAGSNFRGSLSDEAQQASDRLELLLQDLFEEDADASLSVWSVDEWLFASCTLRSHWRGRPLAEAVAKLEAEIARERAYSVVLGDVATALLDEAQRLFDGSGRDQLDAHHIAALLADGRIDGDQAAQHPAFDGPGCGGAEPRNQVGG